MRSARVLTSRKSWVTLAATGVSMVLVAGVGLVPIAASATLRESASDRLSAAAFSPAPCFGALAAVDDCADSHDLQYPDALSLTFGAEGGSVPGYDPQCETPADAPLLTVCTYGPPADQATRTVALMGDSHAVHYTAPLAKLAATEGWRVVSVAQSGCMPIGFDDRVVPLWAPEKAKECRPWAEQAISYIAGRADIGTVLYSSLSREYGYVDGTPTAGQDISDDYVRSWQPWLDAGKRVLVLADTAFLNQGTVLECIGRERGQSDPCASPRDVVLSKPDPMVTAAEKIGSPRVAVFDPNRYICDDRLCHAVVGGIPVFIDQNHMLQAFAMTLSGFLSSSLQELEAAS